jgi:uncharacterized protein
MQLLWLSGPRGASWLQVDTALAELIEPDLLGPTIRVVPGGGAANLAKLAAGEADLATSVTHLAAAAVRGDSPFGPTPMDNLRTLGQGLLRIPFHVVHAGDARTSDLSEALATPGLRIGVPPPSTSDELTFRRVLELSDSCYDRISSNGGVVIHGDYEVLADHFVAAEIDCFFGATAPPSTSVERMASGARKARLLPLGNVVAQGLLAAGFSAGTIPVDTYPEMQAHDISTVQMSSILLTTRALPERIAAAITASLLARADAVRRVHPSLAAFGGLVASDPVIALHDGHASR